MDRSYKIMRRPRNLVVILNRTFLMLRALSFSSMMILMSCLVLVFIKVVGDGVSSVYSASLRGLSANIGGRSSVFLLCNGILGILVLCSSSSVPSSGEEDCDHDHDGDVIQKLLASNVKGDPEVTLLLGRSGAGEEPKNNRTEIQRGEDKANAITPHVFISEYKNMCSQFDHPVTDAIEEEGGAAAAEGNAGDEWCSLSTEELNRRCEDFIRKMREGIKSERRSRSFP
ncbi:hypothetical protein Droror1_Dr00019467 [Drosera rotundifolia]